MCHSLSTSTRDPILPFLPRGHLSNIYLNLSQSLKHEVLSPFLLAASHHDFGSALASVVPAFYPDFLVFSISSLFLLPESHISKTGMRYVLLRSQCSCCSWMSSHLHGCSRTTSFLPSLLNVTATGVPYLTFFVFSLNQESLVAHGFKGHFYISSVLIWSWPQISFSSFKYSTEFQAPSFNCTVNNSSCIQRASLF